MKSTFKKITALLMALMLMLATFGCSSDSDKGDEEEKEGVEDNDVQNDFDEEKDGLQSQSTFKNAKVGDYITFGAYEQDNDTTNGKEAIEWLVIDVQDGKALVVSKYALDCKPYNTDHVDVTWENCTLRSWLNDEFINSAFSADEKMAIPTMTVSTGKSKYNTDPGNATQDKVFLLSIAEANEYFSSDEERQCEPTAYAIASGTKVTNQGNCWWWLRSPGYEQNMAAEVYFDGYARDFGQHVQVDDYAVRPVLWINLES